MTAKAPGRRVLQIHVPDAPNFKPHIEELLKTAGIKSIPDVRTILDTNLNLAWAETNIGPDRPKGRAYHDLVAQVCRSIMQTQKLLRRLEKHPYWQNIAVDLCPVGDGTINTVTVRELIMRGYSLPRNPPRIGPLPERPPPTTEIFAVVSRQRILDRLLRQMVWREPKRRRGRQRELDKRIVVARAVSFFRQYSTSPPTQYVDGPCFKFCKRFFPTTNWCLSPNAMS